MKIKSLNTLCSFILLLFVGNVFANNANFQHYIVKECTEYKNKVDKAPDNLCKLYINGFIDAGILNSLIAVPSSDEFSASVSPKERSDFFKRAYKYRIANDVADVNSAPNAQACLPADLQRELLVSQVAKNLNFENLNEQPVKHTLLATLARMYPCSNQS